MQVKASLLSLLASTANGNRYAPLAHQEGASVTKDDVMEPADEAPLVLAESHAAQKVPKPGPEPIKVPGVNNILAMEQTLGQAVGPDNYESKVH